MVQIRKIESNEVSERKQRRNTLILSIVMIGILLFSTAGYFSLKENDGGAGSDEGVQNYGDSWVFNYNGEQIRLSSPPKAAENVSILLFKSLSDYAGKTVYVASESEAQFYEVSSTVGRYTERMQPACYGKCDKNLPEKSCNDTMIVIQNFGESESSYLKGKIYEESGCVFIDGGIDAVDSFIYKIFGMI